MPRIELPSGAFVEYRDALTAEDQFATQNSFEVKVVNGETIMPSNVQGRMRRALLTTIITAWGGGNLEGIPVPSQNLGGSDVLGRLAIDDSNALAEAVEPLMEKVAFTGTPTRGKAATTPSAS